MDLRLRWHRERIAAADPNPAHVGAVWRVIRILPANPLGIVPIGYIEKSGLKPGFRRVLRLARAIPCTNRPVIALPGLQRQTGVGDSNGIRRRNHATVPDVGVLDLLRA